MHRVSTVSTMTLDGGVDCLDFVNSGYDLQKEVITERLHSFEDLLILAERLELFDKNTIQALRIKARANEQEAVAVLKAAHSVRGLLYWLFAGLAQDPVEKIDRNLLKEVNRLFTEAMQFKLLDDSGQKKLQFSFQTETAGLMAPVWKFVLSAHELLATGNLQYIKQCQRCSWLFLDKTKNHRKKWCSMESCGNSQKTKRYYLNRKLQESGES